MDSKTHLVNTIKEWIQMDTEIKALQKEQNARKKIKKGLNQILIDIMKDNNIDCVDTKDGSSICYTTTNVKKPITKKTLNAILAKYYKGDISKATELNEFILENRGTTIKETIVRK